MTARTAVAPPAVRRSSSRLTMNRTVSGRGVWASAASAECGGYMSLPNSITVDVSAISRWSRLMHIWCADCDSSTGAPSGVVSGTRLIAPTPSQQRISQYTRPGIGTIDSDTPCMTMGYRSATCSRTYRGRPCESMKFSEMISNQSTGGCRDKMYG